MASYNTTPTIKPIYSIPEKHDMDALLDAVQEIARSTKFRVTKYHHCSRFFVFKCEKVDKESFKQIHAIVFNKAKTPQEYVNSCTEILKELIVLTDKNLSSI